jgi:peptidoglycan/xylan/chitin deacetylase (PgdA/CDA1 family)
VPATFFVVPRGEGDWRLDRQTDWLEALRGAERDGHDCQLHGLDHNNCEFGPYPAMIRALGGDPDEALRRDTAQFGHDWRYEVTLERLTTAIGLFESAFCRRPLALRTGALSQMPFLYDAAAEAGMRYASNSVTDPRGWTYIIERYEDPGDWDPNVPPGPYRLTDRIIDLPIISEYAWYLTEEKIPRHLALAIEDLGRVFAEGGVFLLVCHVQCVGAEDGLSQQLLHQLFAVARGEFDVQFQTVADLVAEIEQGSVPVRAR